MVNPVEKPALTLRFGAIKPQNCVCIQKHHVASCKLYFCISHLGWAFQIQINACCKILNGRLIAQRLHLKR